MNRWKAAGIHLAIGLVLIGTIVALIFHFWFPHALYRIAGMDRLLVTMLCVDIVAGPMLTLIVYKRGKPSLRFDLSVIALLQACFLGYALHTAWVSRPVFLVWAIDKMSLVFANDIDAGDLAAGSVPGSNTLSWTGPRLFATRLPKDPAKREKAVLQLIKSRNSVEHLPRFYLPYGEVRASILWWSRPVADPAAGASAAKAADPELQSAIAATGKPASALRVVKIESSRDASRLLIDATTAEPLQVVAPARD